MTTKILFLGCGKMGSILVNNLLEESGFESEQIMVIKRSQKNRIDGLNYVENAVELPKKYSADLVFIAIKPQDAEEILSEFAKQKIFHKKTIFISILAGKKVKFFEKFFGVNAKIIRSMPNLPIQYSQGIFPYIANKNITKLELKNLDVIFQKFGSAFMLDNEKYFDAVTAIFGSGPAYIFLLQEILAEIAIGCGIKKDKASHLVKKLFLGSALMAEFAQENSAKLREAVTSKEGVTEAALKFTEKFCS